MSRPVTIPPAPSAPARAMLAKLMVWHAAARLPFSVAFPGHRRADADRRPNGPELRLRHPGSFYRRLGAQGLIGFGEAYQAGDWDTDDLAGLLAVFAAGVDTLIPPWLQGVRGHGAAPRRPRAEKQTVDGARRNARHHYALPDEARPGSRRDTSTSTSSSSLGSSFWMGLSRPGPPAGQVREDASAEYCPTGNHVSGGR